MKNSLCGKRKTKKIRMAGRVLIGAHILSNFQRFFIIFLSLRNFYRHFKYHLLKTIKSIATDKRKKKKRSAKNHNSLNANSKEKKKREPLSSAPIYLIFTNDFLLKNYITEIFTLC